MAYKKQKGGPKMYRKDGALQMKSPMKNINNMKAYSKPGDAVQFGDGIKMHGEEHDGPKMYGSPNEMEKAPTYMKSPNEMKSSGFKMKSGSPFQRNFGIGASPVKNYSVEKGSHDHPHGDKKSPVEMASPMKNIGIRPVFDDGSLGDHISSTKAKELIKQGKSVMKDGYDEVISNQAELEQKLDDPNIGPKGEENYYSNVGDNLQDKIDMYEDGDVKGKVLIQDEDANVTGTNFAGRTVQEETTTGEGSDYAKWAEYMGPELAAADKEIQAYVNTHGSTEGMPENLLEAQKQLTEKANLMRMENIKGGGGDKNTNIDYGYGQSTDFIDEDEEEFSYGKVETKGGKGGDYGWGHGLTDSSSKHKFQDIEVGPNDVAQQGGTEAAKEQTRLDDIAEKERLAAEALEKENEKKRIADERQKKLEEQRAIEEKSQAWEEENPFTGKVTDRKGRMTNAYIKYMQERRNATGKPLDYGY